MSDREDVQKELEFHLAERTRQLESEGSDRERARSQAERELGPFDALTDACAGIASEVRRGRGRRSRLELAREDLKSGFRLLRRRPWPSATVIGVCALAVSAAVVTSSLVWSTVFQPLPLPGADRVVAIHTVDQRGGLATPRRGSSAPGDVVDWRQLRSFNAVSAVNAAPVTIFLGEEPERIEAVLVAQDIGEVIGVRPHLGRMLRNDDHTSSAAPVSMLTYEYWRRAFGADSSIIGRVLRFSAGQAEVIGVLPPMPLLSLDRRGDVWFPFDLAENLTRGATWLRVIGRLQPNLTLGGAQAELDAVMARLARDEPRTNALRTAWIEPLDRALTHGSRPVLLIITAAIALVVLIACGNLAALLLAMAVDRRGEIALRGALGAGPGRLRQQFMSESLLFCCMGAVLGISVAGACLRAFLALYPGGLPRADEIVLATPMIAGGVALAALFAFLGALPLVRYTHRQRLVASLLSGSRLVAERGAERFRTILVVAQIAFCTVLLIGGVLLLRVYRELTSTPVGFDTEELIAFNITPPSARYATPAEYLAFYDRLIESIEAAPGVTAASYTSLLPFDRDNWTEGLFRENVPQTAGSERFVLYQRVAHDYTRVLGLPLVAGRELAATDREGTPRVAMVNEALAGIMFPGEDPVGQRIGSENRGWIEIVGVVGSKRHRDLTQEPQPELFVPRRQETQGRSLWIVVRTAEPPTLMLTQMRELLRRADPAIAFANAAVMEERVALSIAPQRFRSVLIAALACIAALLATIGIWSLISYGVSRQTREIGIRMALGLEPGRARRAVIVRAVTTAAIGVVLGDVVALIAVRGLTAEVFGIPPVDAGTMVLVGLLFLVITAFAAATPAWRASSIDPLDALRSS